MRNKIEKNKQTNNISSNNKPHKKTKQVPGAQRTTEHVHIYAELALLLGRSLSVVVLVFKLSLLTVLDLFVVSAVLSPVAMALLSGRSLSHFVIVIIV